VRFSFLLVLLAAFLLQASACQKSIKPQVPEILRLHKLWLDGDPAGKQADLSGVELFQASLANANLRGANLIRADLTLANLSHADLRGANLSNAKLQSACLVDADMRGANLRGAVLFHADLTNANLTNANLNHAILVNANLTGQDPKDLLRRGAVLEFPTPQ
jgi:uncharacterized protein YjbI with pentapeptide repeats